MNYEIQELFLYQHAVYKQIVCSSQLIKVKTETKIQIKKKKTLNSAEVSLSQFSLKREEPKKHGVIIK